MKKLLFAAAIIAALVWQGSIKNLRVSAPLRPQITVLRQNSILPNRFAVIEPMADTAPLNIHVNMAIKNPATLKAFIAAQQNPASALYHNYITPAQFALMFGPTTTQLAAVENYLAAQGMTGIEVSANHLIISANATAAQAAAAFQARMALISVQGHVYYDSVTSPAAPQTIAPYITAITGLDNLPKAQPHVLFASKNSATPKVGSGPVGGYTPAQLVSGYDIGSLQTAVNSGANIRIGLVEFDGFTQSDVNAFAGNYSLPDPNITIHLVNGATNTPGSGAIEDELDIEVLNSIAPNAAQDVYIATQSTPYTDVLSAIATADIDPVVSASWGSCEAANGSATLNAMDSVFMEMAAQGQTFFAAAGDSGAYDCNDSLNSYPNLAVDSPADDPYVVGVGGTQLQLTAFNQYQSESVWGDPTDTSNSATGAGGGGGYSAMFNEPSYQNTAPNISDPTQMRVVPDVSANADPATGYSMYCTISASGCYSSGWTIVGGTSAAAPLWTAVMAQIDAYLTAHNKPKAGYVNQALYTYYNSYAYSSAYHDITQGNNLYYSATANYDPASGIGSLDAWNLAQVFVNGVSSSGGTPTPTPSVTATATTTPTATTTATATTTPTATTTATATATPATKTPLQNSIGVYNSQTGTFYLKNSNGNGNADNIFAYGPANSVPLVGDWTGKGYDTVGVYVPQTGAFFLKNTNSAGPADISFVYGPPNSVPLVGDWTGSGYNTVGVYDSKTGAFFLKNTNSSGSADTSFVYGPAGSVPIVGGWVGKGYSSIGAYDSQTGTFFLKNGSSTGATDISFVFGPAGSVPIVGDWTGKGYDSVGAYDSQTGTFFLKYANSAGPADNSFVFGPAGSIPIVGDWTGKGYDSVGVYDAQTGTFYLKNSNSAGAVDNTFAFGPLSSVPIVGDWTGKGFDSVGVYNNGWFYLRNSNAAGNTDITANFGPSGATPIAGKWHT